MAIEQEVVEITLDDAIQEFEAAQQDFRSSAEYYNSEARDLAVGIATPPQLRKLLAQVGIPRLYVHAITDRLALEGFQLGTTAEADEDMWAWFKANSLDTQAALAHIDALVYGRAYITVAQPGEDDKNNPLLVPDIPIIQVESPLALYAEVDPRTNTVQWAIRVVKNNDGDTVAATLYLMDRTELYIDNEGELELDESVAHGLGVVPVIPIVHRQSLTDTYGTSIITPEIKSITDAISRAMMNMQTASELMATPQRIIFGASAEEINGDALTGLELYTSSYIYVDDPAGRAMQLPAAELRNYTEAMEFMLKMAASYTGLPPQYLSFSTDNPASAEAINASETRLVRTCEMVSHEFGDAWERAMRIALIVMGQQLTLDHFRLETLWRDPSTPTMAAKADAVAKLYANGTGIIPLEQARIDMGYTSEQRKKMQEWDAQNPMNQLGAMYGNQPGVKPNETEPAGTGTPSADNPGGE